MRQQSLFDPDVARAARDVAIDRVEAAAPWDWLDAAGLAVISVAKLRSEFTTDDVWALLTTEPPEPRAMGAVIRAAVQDGIIESADKFVCSKRPRCHRRPLRVWRSLLKKR